MLLADEMGLGKTIQAIGALRVLLQGSAPGSALPGSALIVAPAGLVLQWRRQLREWAPELTLSTCIGLPEDRRQRWRAAAQVYLTGFDSLRGDMAQSPHRPENGQLAERIGNALRD